MRIPRWVQIPVGVLFCGFSLLCVVGSASLIFAPPEKNPPLAMAIGSVLLLASIWAVAVSVRLVAGRPRPAGGLLSPLALRLTATLFVAIPVVALFAGTYRARRDRWVLVTQALGHLGLAAAAFRLASARARAGPGDRDGPGRDD